MSFQQGLSGLNSNSKSLEVIGNNIANANTIGAKAARAEFADMYAAALGAAGSNNVGMGVAVSTVAQQFTQGNISDTANGMDVAINGAGFFQVGDGANPVMYTRNGQFKLNDAGEVVNNEGLKLMGRPADVVTGAILAGVPRPLQIPTAIVAPKASTGATLEGNLDSTTDVPGAAVTTIDVNRPSTYAYAATQTAYDAQGQSVVLNYYFQRDVDDGGNHVWNVYMTANGTPVKDDGNGHPEAIGKLKFTPGDGSQPVGANANPPDTTFTMDIPSVSGKSLEIKNFKVDLAKFTEYDRSTTVTDKRQDGFGAGAVTGLSIQKDGTVLATYSNGQSKAAGQIELANFRNPQGLQPVGGNLWARTASAGEPVTGTPNDSGLGALKAKALEASNVDLTNELVGMITAQRLYQANSQSIKTEDQILQTLVNLK